ncbi:MAG: mitochondrial splicing system protein [Vezdaea aestivalis]|nr:MAG: mitochondrial splicing system protein [Vezdaea aestivalis]
MRPKSVRALPSWIGKSRYHGPSALASRGPIAASKCPFAPPYRPHPGCISNRKALHLLLQRPSSHRPKLKSRKTSSLSFGPQALSSSSSSFRARSDDDRYENDTDTIYALSTPPGRSAIAVVRLTGPKCKAVCIVSQSLYGPFLTIFQTFHALCPTLPLPQARHASLRTLVDPTTKAPLDSALLLFLPGPGTFTTHDTLELHLHGSRAVVRAVLGALSTLPFLRPADPGEFTRLAFWGGRLALPQIEALGALLEAETEQARRTAIRGGEGLAERLDGWRAELVDLRSRVEAEIDFKEDHELGGTLGGVVDGVRSLRRGVERCVEGAERGELLRSGIGVALLGETNVGKSSCLNRLVGRDAAIVSPEEGTTRDVVEVRLDVGGWGVRIKDTAGLRGGEGVGPVEMEGVRRARREAEDAEIVVLMLDAARGAQVDGVVLDTVRKCQEKKGNVIVAVNKIDLLPKPVLGDEIIDKLRSAVPGLKEGDILPLSTLEGTEKGDESIRGLSQKLVDRFKALTEVEDGDESAVEALGASARAAGLLRKCARLLDEFLEMMDGEGGEERIVIAAECLRDAAECLARVTGRGVQGDVEDILGGVFEKFCVGK